MIHRRQHLSIRCGAYVYYGFFIGPPTHQAVLSRFGRNVFGALPGHLIEDTLHRRAEHPTQAEVPERLMQQHPNHIVRGPHIFGYEVHLVLEDKAVYLAFGTALFLLSIVVTHGLRNCRVLHILDHHDFGSVAPARCHRAHYGLGVGEWDAATSTFGA